MKSDLPNFSEIEKACLLAYLNNPKIKTGVARFQNPPRFVISIKHRQATQPIAVGIAKNKRQSTIAALESLRRRFNNASQSK